MAESGAIKTLESSQSLVGTKTRRRSMAGKLWKATTAVTLSFLPILEWLPRYSIRDNLVSDMVGGFTVGIMHVPQGIAYASLAGVRPVIGLYTSLLAPLFYMIFGTSRHISIGVFAVVSLMCGACNVRVTDAFFASSSFNYTEDEMSEAKLDYAVHVLSGLGFVIGLIQISMGLLRLDFLIGFLSDQVVNGFMVGASFHVLVAQLDKLLGVTLPRRGGIGKLFMTLYDVFQSVIDVEINLYTLALSISAIIFLFAIKTFVDPSVKRITPLPVPYDLFLLILGTILSTVFDFNGTLRMKIIGKIPTGLPSISPPDLTVVPHIIGDAAAISVVILVVSISMAKVFAKKHKYEINIRQEFFALGLVESLGSFFPVWPSSTALARTLVYEAAGTKTQLATVFSSSLLLAVLFFVGPYLELLPVCLLSCVIVVALKGMFMKLGDIPSLWRVSRIDAVIFVMTLSCTISLNVIEGLACGAAVSIIHILLASKRGGFTELEHPQENREKRPIKVLRYDGSLYFMNIEEFSCTLRDYAKLLNNEIKSSDDSESNEEESESAGSLLLVDLSTLRFIDYSGSSVLLTMISNLEKERVRLYYLATSESIILTLHALPDWPNKESHLFASIEDAFEKMLW